MLSFANELHKERINNYEIILKRKGAFIQLPMDIRRIRPCLTF